MTTADSFAPQRREVDVLNVRRILLWIRAYENTHGPAGPCLTSALNEVESVLGIGKDDPA
jgi:hypothetical protein